MLSLLSDTSTTTEQLDAFPAQPLTHPAMVEGGAALSPFADREAAAAEYAELAPRMAGRAVMRKSPDGGRTFPTYKDGRKRLEVALRPVLGPWVVSIPVGDINALTGRWLVLDLDIGLVPAGTKNRTGYVAEVSARLCELLEKAGLRYIRVATPSGGVHLHIPFAVDRPWQELRELTEAVARRFPVVDAKPMRTPDGQIRPPGGLHKLQDGRLTGYVRLWGQTLAQAMAVCEYPGGSTGWNALHEEFEAELAAVAGGDIRILSAGSAAQVDRAGHHWTARLGGSAALPAELEDLARTGQHAAHGYRSRSEARMAAFGALFYRGWHLADVLEQMRPGGRWPGLAALFDGKRGWRGDDGVSRSPEEHLWRKIALEFQGGDPASYCNTSVPISTRPRPPTCENSGCEVVTVIEAPVPVKARRGRGELSQWQQIRQWHNAVRIAQQDPQVREAWGGCFGSAMVMLRAAGAAAQMSGSATIEFGVRNLGELMAGVHKSTASRVLRMLREGELPFLDLVQEGRGERADVYQLVIPEQYADEAAWRPWRPGRIEALHAVFLELGASASLVYEALGGVPSTPAELERLTGLSRATVDRMLKRLGEHGLAQRSALGEWARGPVTLDEAARAVDAYATREALHAGHLGEREIWRSLVQTWESSIKNNQDAADEEPDAAEQEERKIADVRARGRKLPPGARPAPRTMTAPPARRRITPDDLAQPSPEELAELAEALAAEPLPPLDPNDLLADNLADFYERLEDADLLAAERDQYEAELQKMRMEAPQHARG